MIFKKNIGAKLKKAQTNDRSAPDLSSPKPGVGGNPMGIPTGGPGKDL